MRESDSVQSPDYADWLSQITEEVLEPDLPICDPHHHLWDYTGSRYLLDDLLKDIGSGHNIVSTVFVECGAMYRSEQQEPDPGLRPVGETEFVNGVAAMSASGGYGNTLACAGIVGFADLSLGSQVRRVLEAHMRLSPRFRGIRHALGWHQSDAIRNSHSSPTQGLMADAAFRKGFQELGKLDLTFDAWFYHEQIPEFTDLARSHPEVTCILDHFGGPLGIGPYEGKRKEVFEFWRKAVAELAELPNVHAKLGGLVMPINGFGFHKRSTPATSEELVAATRDYYLHAIDCFGVERCMFESNFPVDKRSCSYHVLWNSFKRLADGFSAREKAWLFHDTAAKVYGVNRTV